MLYTEKLIKIRVNQSFSSNLHVRASLNRFFKVVGQVFQLTKCHIDAKEQKPSVVKARILLWRKAERRCGGAQAISFSTDYYNNKAIFFGFMRAKVFLNLWIADLNVFV